MKRAKSEKESTKWRRELEVKKRAQSEEQTKKTKKKWIFQALSKLPEAIYKEELMWRRESQEHKWRTVSEEKKSH